MELNTLLLGDSLEKLKELEDNSVDSIVTDPPYGLGKEPDPVEVMTDWIKQGYHEVKSTSGGFMGAKWDAFIPQPILWKECLRLLKPGGHLLSFFGSRTYDWGVMALRFAGFEIRDSIDYFFDEVEAAKEFMESLDIEQCKAFSRLIDAHAMDSISWIQSQGFPKSLDIGKATKDEAWSGYGSGLKPAHENIIICRKPISENNIAANVLKHGTGGINIDGCRVGHADTRGKASLSALGQSSGWNSHKNREVIAGSSDGRFPANVIFECTCDELLESGEANTPYEYKNNEYEVEGFIHNIKPNSPSNYNDHKRKVVHTNPNCPCYHLDMQSGKLKSGLMKKDQHRHQDGGFHGGFPQDRIGSKDTYGDTGGASRFFYQAKTSKKERNIGLANTTFTVDGKEVTGNFHSTVKPLSLMRYLVRLVTPKGGVCLDPFIGSGTTAMACILEDCNYIGIDNNPDYLKIAELRIKEVVGV